MGNGAETTISAPFCVRGGGKCFATCVQIDCGHNLDEDFIQPLPANLTGRCHSRSSSCSICRKRRLRESNVPSQRRVLLTHPLTFVSFFASCAGQFLVGHQ
jgi:hypothetical protein